MGRPEIRRCPQASIISTVQGLIFTVLFVPGRINLFYSSLLKLTTIITYQKLCER